MEISQTDYPDSRPIFSITPSANYTGIKNARLNLMRNSQTDSTYYTEETRLYAMSIAPEGEEESNFIYLNEIQVEEILLAFSHMQAEYDAKTSIPLKLETE